MNNKGFTLIELLATIILLAIIMTITTVSVVNVMDISNKQSYSVLVDDIKIAAQAYFDECENKNIVASNISCPTPTSNGNKKYIIIEINELLDVGFLNGTNDGGTKKIKNPTYSSPHNVGDCKIKITKEVIPTNNFVTTYYVEASGTSYAYCPSTNNYKGIF